MYLGWIFPFVICRIVVLTNRELISQAAGVTAPEHGHYYNVIHHVSGTTVSICVWGTTHYLCIRVESNAALYLPGTMSLYASVLRGPEYVSGDNASLYALGTMFYSTVCVC